MARTIERLALKGSGPGCERHVTVRRYGQAGARPKAYVQAAIHADEIPALLFAHHLAALLDDAEATGQVSGEVVLVPYANPIGLDQWLNAEHLGRYDLGGSLNFNRRWPDPMDGLDGGLAHRLTSDAASNVEIIRTAMKDGLAARTPETETDSLRLCLAALAVDADIVLDVHCDDEAPVHIYLLGPLWPDARDLSCDIGSCATLLADDSGGGSFDETMSSPWAKLAARHPDRPIPQACLASTLELRGKPDVFDSFARADARSVLRFLRRRSVVAGDPGPLPEPRCEATPLDAVDVARAPATGVLCYRVELGQAVATGETIAEIMDPAAEDPRRARTAVQSATDGYVLSRRQHKYVAAGAPIAKIVGSRSLPHRRSGALLED